MARFAVGIVLLALVMGGCGTRQQAAVPRTEPPAAPASITGATPEQEALLREILGGLGARSSIRSVHVRPAIGSDWGSSDPGAVVIDVRGSPKDSARTEWEVELLGEAFSERSHDGGLQPVVALESGGGGGNVSIDPEAPPDKRAAISAETLRAKIEDAATAAGADVLDLDVLQPDRVAIAVTLQTDDPRDFLKNADARFIARVPNPEDAEYGGIYAEALDKEGNAFWQAWLTTTVDGAGASTQWVRPELRGCGLPTFGFVSGGPPGRPPPPPCPAY